MPRRLIINADDLGLHAARNRAIFEAVDAGVVTAVSVLVNLVSFHETVEGLHARPGVGVGLHFNISEGRPVLHSWHTLVDASGNFRGKEETRRRALAGMLDPMEVQGEMEAQAKGLREYAGHVDHVDGHQHIHVYGEVARAVAGGAARVGVARTRLPIEPPELSEGLPEPRRAQIARYRALAEEAAGWFEARGMRTADHFRGLAISGRMTAEGLVALVRALPEGVTELMVHPGYANASQGFDGPEREAELRALLHPSFRKAIAEEGIELVGHRRTA